MGLEVIPEAIRNKFHIEERWHACAVLSVDCRAELADILECLEHFVLLRSEIEQGGGGKSKIATRFDDFLRQREWKEKKIKVSRTIGEKTVEAETHKVDFSKGLVPSNPYSSSN